MPDINVGKRIKDLRELKGLTEKELAEKVDITAKYLSEIESGKRNFSSGVLCRMSENLGASCDYIMFGKNTLTGSSEMIALMEQMDERQKISIQRILKVLSEVTDAF